MVVSFCSVLEGWSPREEVNRFGLFSLCYSTGFILIYLDEMIATKMVANVKQAANM